MSRIYRIMMALVLMAVALSALPASADPSTSLVAPKWHEFHYYDKDGDGYFAYKFTSSYHIDVVLSQNGYTLYGKGVKLWDPYWHKWYIEFKIWLPHYGYVPFKGYIDHEGHGTGLYWKNGYKFKWEIFKYD